MTGVSKCCIGEVEGEPGMEVGKRGREIPREEGRTEGGRSERGQGGREGGWSEGGHEAGREGEGE